MGTAIALVAAACLALVILLWAFQRWLIYLPLTQQVPPVDLLLPGAEEVRFPTADGLTLAGWFLDAGPDAWGNVLVFNGNAGHRAFRSGLAAALAREGLTVLLFDYRGYGGNPGAPSEAGLMADARAARRFLAGLPGVDVSRSVYLGESLGAGVAVALAAEDPPAALVLRSPFPSLVDVGRLHYPFLPVGLLLADRYPSVDRIGAIRAPLLVVAGEADTIVPVELSRRLFAAAGEPKRFVAFPGLGHNDPEFLDGQRFIDEVTRFLRGALPPGETF